MDRKQIPVYAPVDLNRCSGKRCDGSGHYDSEDIFVETCPNKPVNEPILAYLNTTLEELALVTYKKTTDSNRS